MQHRRQQRLSRSSLNEDFEAYNMVLKDFEERKGHFVPVFSSSVVESQTSRRTQNKATPSPQTAGQQHRSTGSLLVIDVQLGPGRVEKLSVRSGDNAHRIAATFVQKHGLDSSCIRPLADRVQQAVTEYSFRVLENERMATVPERSSPSRSPGTDITSQPFDLETEKRAQQRRKELLTFIVDICPGKKGSITVREGDDPYQLAKNFVIAFQLRKTLIEQIASKITSLLKDATLTPRNSQEAPPSTPTAISQTSKQQQPKSILFDLEVDLPEGIKGVIRVYDGASPRKLAYEFAAKYHLPSVLIDVLEQLIDQQICSYTNKKIHSKRIDRDKFSGKVVAKTPSSQNLSVQ